jgi:hypothetical protein
MRVPGRPRTRRAWTHAEIERLAARLATHLELDDAAGRLDPSQVEDVLATLYGLYAVLRLHFVQEEEDYFALASEAPQEERPHERTR